MRWFGWFRRKQGAVSAQTPTGQVVMEGERLRTAGVPYALPRDNEEINRLDFQHYMLRYALRGNYAAPLQQPHAILDVGCGTGRWAREMAMLFPEANVIGTDVVEPPSDQSADVGASPDVRPVNYAFVPGNVLERLPFADAGFDYVHQRLLFLAVPAQRWPEVIRELVRVTRVGGWVESVELGHPQGGGPAIDQLFNWGSQLVANRGVDTRFSPNIPGLMQSAGLMRVEARRIELPLGAYGGRVGNMASADLLTAIRALGDLIVRAGLATNDQFERLLAQARIDVDLPMYRCVVPFFVTFGQRPA